MESHDSLHPNHKPVFPSFNRKINSFSFNFRKESALTSIPNSMRSFLAVCFALFIISEGSAQKKANQSYPSLLWEITGNGLTQPSYLFGTMHVSNKLAFHLSDSFYNAIASCS